jgi:hypothetical protein
MAYVKLNELGQKAQLYLTDLMAVSDSNGVLYGNTLQQFNNLFNKASGLDFKGSISAGTYATKDAGWYFATNTGNYIMGSTTIAVDVSDTLTIIIVNTVINDSSKVEVPISIVIDSTIIDGSTNAVSGNAVFDGLALKEDVSATTTTKENIFSESTELEILDALGYVILKANKDGITLTDLLSETGEIIVCDVDGFVAFKITNAGIEYVGQNQGGSSNTEIIEGDSLADIVQVIVYGQSLSVGGSATSAIDFYDAKMFNGGILTNYDPNDTVARDAYYASALVPLATTGSETPGKGFVRAYKDTIASLNNIPIASQDFELLVNAPGTGGSSLAQLSDVNGIYYRRLIESVQKAQDFSLAQGKNHVVGALTYWQGENTADTVKTETQYFNECTAMFTALNTDIKAITGQNFDVNFIVYQVATYTNNGSGTPGPALAFLKMAREVTNITLAPVMYAYTYTDGFHVDSASTRAGGACAGTAAAKTIFNNDKPLPMYPTNHFISSNSADNLWSVRLEIPAMVAPLVIDTVTVPAISNYGFSIKNISDVEIITNVKVNRNSVTIITNQNPTGLKLTYCITGVAAPGNVRDSQNYQISHNGVNYPVHNWLPMFEYTL